MPDPLVLGFYIVHPPCLLLILLVILIVIVILIAFHHPFPSTHHEDHHEDRKDFDRIDKIDRIEGFMLITHHSSLIIHSSHPAFFMASSACSQTTGSALKRPGATLRTG